MQALAQWAGYLAVAGGAVIVLIAAVLVVDPSSPIWYAFFAPVLLLGLDVFGLQQRARAATGQLGAASAWLSVVGVAGLLLTFV